MNIKDQKEFFNKTYESWKDVSDEKERIIFETIDRLGISEGSSVLDVASGTGVLYGALRGLGLCNYVALDISENMLKELKGLYPEAKTICGDFDKEIVLKDSFDYIVIFNSIPHFENVDMLFDNASRHLKSGGTFAIVHSRTREGLKQHHRRIGYVMDRQAIPEDSVLLEAAARFGFKDCTMSDDGFFYFCCRK
jgi:demethylmenaquinone methyltransferase/2-methoxy-6-polyprenyl-1,4-benzoquinol methylase